MSAIGQYDFPHKSWFFLSSYQDFVFFFFSKKDNTGGLPHLFVGSDIVSLIIGNRSFREKRLYLNTDCHHSRSCSQTWDTFQFSEIKVPKLCEITSGAAAPAPPQAPPAPALGPQPPRRSLSDASSRAAARGPPQPGLPRPLRGTTAPHSLPSRQPAYHLFTSYLPSLLSASRPPREAARPLTARGSSATPSEQERAEMRGLHTEGKQGTRDRRCAYWWRTAQQWWGASCADDVTLRCDGARSAARADDVQLLCEGRMCARVGKRAPVAVLSLKNPF